MDETDRRHLCSGDLTIVFQQLFLELRESEPVLWGAGAIVIETHLVQLNPQKKHRHWYQRHPTPVLSPGKSHGWRSLAGYSPWGCKESDTSERLTHTHTEYKGLKDQEPKWLLDVCLINFLLRPTELQKLI